MDLVAFLARNVRMPAPETYTPVPFRINEESPAATNSQKDFAA